MKVLHTLVVIICSPVVCPGAAPKKFESIVVSKKTPGYQIEVEIDIAGAKSLFLEVGDGGNGSGYDWADWIEPRLIGPDGTEMKLTDLTWAEVIGRAQVNRNQGGDPLRVNGKAIAYGLGTHATSLIRYDLPKGYKLFRSGAGIDDGGVDQPNSHPTVQFRAYTAKNRRSVGLNATLPEGFRAQKLYDVDLNSEGSWVALCVDGKGRLIASDRQGAMYRIKVPPLDEEDADAEVERLGVDVGHANGLLEAFGSLYVVGKGQGKSGLFRLTDTTGDDQFDKVEHLMSLAVGSDHHGHAVILSPDKRRLVILCGNSTDYPSDIVTHKIQHQKEDHLLPRSTYYGHNTNRMAPGGFVVSCLPDGSDRTIECAGFRNPYDIAFNHDGELFTFDADMEYDVGGPWYRPTRVNHAVSGGEFGWRFGAGKWPAYYPDTVGSVVDIGRGSPTGIVFGYGAKFPEKYQRALYICDWTYGKIYAVHMTLDGASYAGQFEPFVSGRAMPVSDIVIHPTDGAMYFIAGGRRSKSSLVRVTYDGSGPTAAVDLRPSPSPLRDLRHELESMHGGKRPADIARAIGCLGHADRAVRYAARTVIEHQPVEAWAGLALKLDDPIAVIEVAVAMSRVGVKNEGEAIRAKLNEINFAKLAREPQLDFLRAQGLVFIRLGAPSESAKNGLIERLSSHFPSGDLALDRELCQMLLYVGAPDAVSKSVQKLLTTNTQADQMFYAYHLRTIGDGWSEPDLKSYFGWMQTAEANSVDYTGGGHFKNFLKMVRKEALNRLDEGQMATVQEQLSSPPKPPVIAAAPRDFVRQWTVEDLKPELARIETDRSFIRGKSLHQVLCASCHLFKGKGGALGPDLTSVGSKYDYATLVTEIIEPSRVISDQHVAIVLKLKDGTTLFGRELGGDDDTVTMAVDITNPDNTVEVKKADIAERTVSPVSLMPPGLLNTLNKEEVLDLIMYLSAGGNIGHTAFQK